MREPIQKTSESVFSATWYHLLMPKKIVSVKTKYGSFRCVLEPEKDMGGYVAEAQGVQGAVSWGKTLAEAKTMIAEAIEGVIEVRIIIKAAEKGIVKIRRGGSTPIA